MAITLFVFVAIFSILGYSKFRSEKFILFVFISLALILMSGLRYKVGVDYENYNRIYKYEKIHKSPEILFFSFSYLFSKILKFEFKSFVFITSLISIYFKIYFLYKNTRYYLFALLIYTAIIYSIYDIGFIRQALAIGILGLGFYADRRQRSVKAIILYVLAFMFHSTAIIILPIYIIGNKIKKISLPILPVLLCSFILGNYIIDNLIVNVALLIPNEFIVGKVLFYIENYPGTGFSLNVVRSIIVCLFLRKAEDNLYKKYYYLGTIVFLLFSFNVQFASRFYSYILILEPILVANHISKLKKENKKYIILAVILFYTVIFLYNIYLFNFIEYKSVLGLI
jgi:hypothetical protein